MQQKYQIRATFDCNNIAVYAAFSSSIADVALQNQKLLAPFSYHRMTWIKPSFLWLMYRSNWAESAGMERILQIWIKRTEWDNALKEAILTTPEAHVYKDAKKWRKQLDKARIRVQWDPERNIKNERLNYKSIQIGITTALSETYAKKWITKIEDMTPITRQIQALVAQKNYEKAIKFLPEERIYPVNDEICKVLGI